jgi:hypothetical protein
MTPNLSLDVMSSPGMCPHCGARIRARGILRVSRRTPYTCASCRAVSVMAPRSAMRVVLGWVVALAFPLALLNYLQMHRVVLFAVCVGAALAIPLIFARFCRFETEKGSRDH